MEVILHECTLGASPDKHGLVMCGSSHSNLLEVSLLDFDLKATLSSINHSKV